MKSIVLAAMISTLALTAGCVTSGGSYCDIARSVYISKADQMTEETKRQILRENEKVAGLCGVKP